MFCPSPFAVVLLVKLAPPLVEILKPPWVAAYKALSVAKTPSTLLLPSPSAVVLLIKLAPPSLEMLRPFVVAA